MATNSENYKALKADIAGSGLYSVAYRTGQLEEKHVIGMAKMGFNKIEQGQAFSDNLERYPNLEKFFARIGNESVSSNALNPVMRAFGDKYRANPNLLANLSSDFRDNPAVERQLMDAIHKNPAAAARAIGAYTGAESGPGRLETLAAAINSPPVSQPETRTVPKVVKAAPAATGAGRQPREDAPRERARPPAPPATVERRPDPVTTVAGATVAAPVTAAPPAAAAGTTAAPPPAGAAGTAGDDIVATPGLPASTAPGGRATVTAADVKRLADPLVKKLKQVFPDMNKDGSIDNFGNKLKTDTGLQARIAANLNNNPGFIDQMMSLSSSKDAGSDDLFRRFGREPVSALLANPEKLAEDGYVKGLSSGLSQMLPGGPGGGAGGGLGGMLSKGLDFFKNIDWGGLVQKGLGFLKMIGSKIGEFLTRICGGGNYVSADNGTNGRQFANLNAQAFEAGMTEGRPINNNIQRVAAADGAALDPETMTVDANGVKRTNEITGQPIADQPVTAPGATPAPGQRLASNDPNVPKPVSPGTGPGGGASMASLPI